MGSEASRPPGSGDIPAEWLAEFEAAARRPLATRFRYAFIHTYKPVLDDAPFRAFDTTADYRRWCEENLPDWLGYGRPSTSTSSSRRTASSVSRTPGGAA